MDAQLTGGGTVASHVMHDRPINARRWWPVRGEPGFFLAPGLVFMVLAFLGPLAIIGLTSLQTEAGAFSGAAYAALTKSALFARVAWGTFQVSAITSVLTVLLGYPVALHLSVQAPRRRRLLMTLVLVPFWTSILVKSFAFIVLFGKQGLLNQALAAAFSLSFQLDVLFTRTGMSIALAQQLVPFVVLPLLASLLAIDQNLYRAASVAGASRWQVFTRVTLPLSRPGLSAGFLLTFMLCVGAYVTPALIGGNKDLLMANLIDFRLREANDWAGACAMAIVMLLVCVVLLFLLRRARSSSIVR